MKNPSPKQKPNNKPTLLKKKKKSITLIKLEKNNEVKEQLSEIEEDD